MVWGEDERYKRRKNCENPKGFTMKQFCKNQSTKSKKGEKLNSPKKEFKFNKNDPKKSFDVYIDKDPSDTINIKYKTVKDVAETIKNLEKLYKGNKYTHKRIWQVGMIMKVRLEAILKHNKTLYKNAKNIKSRYNLANKYFKFLGRRTKKDDIERKQMIFKI